METLRRGSCFGGKNEEEQNDVGRNNIIDAHVILHPCDSVLGHWKSSVFPFPQRFRCRLFSTDDHIRASVRLRSKTEHSRGVTKLPEFTFHRISSTCVASLLRTCILLLQAEPLILVVISHLLLSESQKTLRCTMRVHYYGATNTVELNIQQETGFYRDCFFLMSAGILYPFSKYFRKSYTVGLEHILSWPSVEKIYNRNQVNEGYYWKKIIINIISR